MRGPRQQHDQPAKMRLALRDFLHGRADVTRFALLHEEIRARFPDAKDTQVRRALAGCVYFEADGWHGWRMAEKPTASIVGMLYPDWPNANYRCLSDGAIEINCNCGRQWMPLGSDLHLQLLGPTNNAIYSVDCCGCNGRVVLYRLKDYVLGPPAPLQQPHTSRQ